jgi:predicted mannosyl-3-phosphoglycerate phosphatase (HAD superfamily)
MPDPTNDIYDRMRQYLADNGRASYHDALILLVAERDALRKERQMYWESCDALEKQNLDLRNRVEELRTKEDSWKSARKMALDDIDKADAERIAVTTGEPPDHPPLALFLWMKEVTHMLYHSRDRYDEQKEQLLAQYYSTIAEMRKGNMNGK